ncbi:MAG: F0F1 ATP synthase subunit gamma [Acidimicrobiales bacterium]|nr:F0F1 ATP synthase subunit gamma [Acidimicrobiia bacterium]NNC79875.1 F0F1 ATP synthase subunit gamma [Acidimicrobiales bacterium]RZV47515.1 MAG: F0F1 ATP synthase subunit gamma [Acidimicrobiales bacterium]
MPGAKERELRRRIGSVQSTKKITRAMELIAATRVVKAMQRANEAKPYAAQVTGVIENLAAGGASVDHPLLREVDEAKRVGIIAITSDRGLAGAYNASVIRAAERQLDAARTAGADYALILIGKKAIDYFTFRHYEIAAQYTGMSDTPTYENAREVADNIVTQFTAGDLDRVELVYTEFVTMGTQRVTVRRYLPLESTSTIAEGGSAEAGSLAQFEFEPSPGGVLESLLPRYMESRLYSAMLEAAASEHANRQRAMKAATDNAEDLITKLSREMNQARQASITTEIMEIVGGAEAMGSGDDSAIINVLENMEGATA